MKLQYNLRNCIKHIFLFFQTAFKFKKCINFGRAKVQFTVHHCFPICLTKMEMANMLWKEANARKIL